MRKIYLSWAVAFVLAFVFLKQARADVAGNLGNSLPTTVSQSFLSNFFLKNAVMVSSDPFGQGAAQQATLGFRIMPGVHLDEHWTVASNFGLIQLPDGTTQITDGVVAARYKAVPLNQYFKFSPSAGLVVPFSAKSVTNDSLITELRVAPRLDFDMRQIGGFYEVSFAQDFNTYDTSPTFNPVTSNRIQQWLDLHYKLTSKIIFSYETIFTSNWSYTGAPFNYIAFDQCISYLPIPNLVASIGHSSGGDTLGVVGTDSSLKQLFVQNSTDFFGSILYTW